MSVPCDAIRRRARRNQRVAADLRDDLSRLKRMAILKCIEAAMGAVIVRE